MTPIILNILKSPLCMHWNNVRVLTNSNREEYEAGFSLKIESGTYQNDLSSVTLFKRQVKREMIWYHLKQSFRRKSEDIRRPLIPGENIDQVYRQKERERKRKKLEEKKKIIPGRASDSQLYYIKDNSSIKCSAKCCGALWQGCNIPPDLVTIIISGAVRKIRLSKLNMYPRTKGSFERIWFVGNQPIKIREWISKRLLGNEDLRHKYYCYIEDAYIFDTGLNGRFSVLIHWFNRSYNWNSYKTLEIDSFRPMSPGLIANWNILNQYLIFINLVIRFSETNTLI